MTPRTSILEGRSMWVVAVLAVFAYAAVHLTITSGSMFYHDEWAYLCGRSLVDIASWLRPHNEHFVLLHVVGYRLLVDAFGLGSYVPYQLALIGTHVAVASAVFVLTDRHAGRRAAAAAGVLMLFLGSGALNLFWAFQIGMVGAAALGLWALVLLPGRPAGAALVLTAAVATSGVGLVYVIAAGAYLAAAGRLRSTVWLLIPVLAYGTWALTMRASVDPRAEFSLVAMVVFLVGGIAYATAGVMGLGLPSAAIGAVGLLASRPTAWRSPLVVGCALALIAQFAIIGSVRQEVSWPGASHYVYVGSTFVILVGATLLASARRPRIGGVLFTIAITANVIAFLYYGLAWPSHTERHNLAGEGHPSADACYETPSLAELKRLAGVDGE